MVPTPGTWKGHCGLLALSVVHGFPSPIFQKTSDVSSTEGGVFSLHSTIISQNECVGPNNCFGVPFKWKMALVMLGYIILNHAYVKFVLQGVISSKLRAAQNVGDGLGRPRDSKDASSNTDAVATALV